MILFPSTTPTLDADVLEMRVLLGHYAAPMFCFGPHASTVPQLSMERAPDVDGMFVGEPEDGVLALVTRGVRSSLAGIPGLTDRDAGGAIVPHTSHGSFTGFAEMPIPAWDMLNLGDYTLPLEGKPYI
jgi:hypothetical protein